MILLAVPLTGLALRDVPGPDAGVASGTFSMFQQFGNAFGVAIVGLVFFGVIGSGDVQPVYQHVIGPTTGSPSPPSLPQPCAPSSCRDPCSQPLRAPRNPPPVTARKPPGPYLFLQRQVGLPSQHAAVASGSRHGRRRGGSRLPGRGTGCRRLSQRRRGLRRSHWRKNGADARQRLRLVPRRPAFHQVSVCSRGAAHSCRRPVGRRPGPVDRGWLDMPPGGRRNGAQR